MDHDVVFIRGEPPVSGGRGQAEWQAEILRRVGSALERAQLTFVVTSLRRRGQLFDLDNLVHPVLGAVDDPVEQMSARLYVGDEPGVLIKHGHPELPTHIERSVFVVDHSAESAQARKGIPEIENDPVMDVHEGIGLSLVFDSADVPIRRGWFGPTEAVIDDLVPWFGTYTKRNLIADHRLRDLRISRGANPGGSGVCISIWYVPDAEVSVPTDVLRRIAAAS